MKSLIFDAGPVISLTTNNLLWVLDYLKEEFKGDFVIPKAVKGELVDKPIRGKKYKFEALQVDFRIRKGVLTVVENPKIKILADELLQLANHVFKVKGNWINIVHYAEMEVLATQIINNANGVVIDERVTRLLIDDPASLKDILGRHLKGKVFVDKRNLTKFRNWTKDISVLRSVELIVVAYEKGFLDKYLSDKKDAKKVLLESLLWGVKIRGASISRREINEIMELELGN
ncbi:hypothetical protein ACFL0V_05940 [Nanoarchaeota archaeon]